ncbi:hypothetical protein F2Q69_00020589 [Brassica cretica]|uniref:Uncharacterized protein n=1 Tax=Brassica cretica TaxID=69181 RepID=A0A8S9QG30_BRACR|nr:hypothetical protein F2Q69_00020589 [Brassica cretica]
MRPNRSRNHLVLVIPSGEIPTTTEPHKNGGDLLQVIKSNGEEIKRQRVTGSHPQLFTKKLFAAEKYGIGVVISLQHRRVDSVVISVQRLLFISPISICDQLSDLIGQSHQL